MAAQQACIYCGSKAVRWCDLVIGFDNSKGPLASLDTPVFRCDAPLCERHAVFMGNIFFHGSGGAGCESVDHCCNHEDYWREGMAGGWHPDKERWEPISADEAERRRYRHRCIASGPLRLI